MGGFKYLKRDSSDDSQQGNEDLSRTGARKQILPIA